MHIADLRRLVPEATDDLFVVLDPAHGSLEPPIRAEIFGADRFAQHGRSLAETHRAAPAGLRGRTFVPRLRDNIQALREAYRYIGLQARSGYDISPAAEWLLDNFHLIDDQLQQVQDGLPRRYFRALPVLLDPPLAGLPRVYGVAWAFVAHTDGAFDEALLAHYLGAYQQVRELTLGEAWALPTTLRVVLIENLRRLAERLATNKAARELANLVCDRIERLDEPTLDRLHAAVSARGAATVYLAQMSLRLQDAPEATPDDGARRVAAAWLARVLPDPIAVQLQQNADQASDNLSVSNAITSLRAIGDAEWTDLVAATSPMMQVMLASPMFEAEHPTTRDRTLHGIEALARRIGRSERDVALALRALMSEAEGATDAPAPTGRRAALRAAAAAPQRVAGHWLQGPGRAELARRLRASKAPATAAPDPRAAADGTADGAAEAVRLSATPSPTPFGERWLQRIGPRGVLPLYLGVVLAGTLLLVAWTLFHTSRLATLEPVPWLVAAFVLMLLPASEAAVAVVHRLIGESLRPRHVPRLALPRGIPSDHRVMVVVPALLTTPAVVEALVHRLRLHHLANPERFSQFALLSDWPDAAAAQAPDDAAILASARQRIERLNELHPAEEGQPPRFLLLHRVRRHSRGEGAWIGWERKRGKLEQLIAWLATGVRSDDFLDLGRLSEVARETRYVVTLDSDTELPPGRLRELVGIAAHPENRPRIDAKRRRVVGGYAILQPRLATPLPQPHEFTWFHGLFAGQPGIDPYSAASSEVYQDLFGEGTYTGKGLLDVQALHAVLHERLPSGQVLSHDLLEGAIARCAAITDVTLIEDAPFHADVAASRVHRWTRGDWQLLPFLVAWRRYGLSPVNRWKLFDNLRRSLVAPASLAAVVLALSTGVVHPAAMLLLVFFAYAGGPLMGALAAFTPSRDTIATAHFYRQAGTELARAVGTGLWHLSQLLSAALRAADAILRALFRMAVSRRRLLQWTTAAAAQAQAGRTMAVLWQRHWPTTAAAAGLLVLLLATGTATPGWTLACCAAWALTPLWIGLVSRPRETAAEKPLPAEDRERLLGIARDTWGYFERVVTADDRHLPPDNLQTAPFEALARRTSPTNIGLYLLATACAQRFGWITPAQMADRLEATLGTLDTLERHRGHFLNWYDTGTGDTLLPRYVSAVDSGNLCGHLLAVSQACRALAGVEPPLASRLQAIAARCDALAWAPDFAFLLDPRRRLLHIGYRVVEQQLDTGYYDLLASEARLTSLLAIAKGDLPVSHWAALGRPFFADGAHTGLRSWSGSMFEYLMPGLVLNEPAGSVLCAAAASAVREQIAHGDAHGVPWGVSESAYAGRDHTLAYQYGPQGVPRLALRRTPPDELVIAPYATLLAAQVAPRAALENLARLDALGARGRYGYIEALDYTPGRQEGDAAFAPVHTFMAHHQGMSLVALANVLLDGVARRWGMADPHLEAVASLLQERVPREIAATAPPPSVPAWPGRERAPGLLRELSPGATALAPTHLLSNGRYSVSLRPNGAGWSRWAPGDGRAFGINRWRDDALRDAHGQFLWIRWDRRPQPVSLTQHPSPDPDAAYRSTFHADRVAFEAAWPELQATTTAWVSPEDDVEFRRVELRNLGDRPLALELISAFDVTLADPRADEAHPAFSNLFVSTRWLPASQALVFERKPRLVTERGLRAAHFLAEADPQTTAVLGQTDRLHWLGRNGTPSHPLARLDPLPASSPDAEGVTLQNGLDPVCALAVQVTLPPGGRARFCFATAASDQSGTLRAVVDKYRQASHVERASLMSATLAGIRLRELGISPETHALVQPLATALALGVTRPSAAATSSVPSPGVTDGPGGTAACDRRLLWRFGISGDRPILLVSAGVPQGLGLLRALAQGLRLWAWGGLPCDLVVLNGEPTSYQMTFQRELGALRDRHVAETATVPAGAQTGFHVLRTQEISSDELATLHAVARVHLHADGRPLAHHVGTWLDQHEDDGRRRDEASVVEVPVAVASTATASHGSFRADGAYEFPVHALTRPARPWINVLSNPGFGAQVSEAGSGYSWAVNSRMNQLTGWSNDAVGDPPSEWFLLQDLQTRAVSHLAPSAWGEVQAAHEVVHRQGETFIRHRRGDVDVEIGWCVDARLSVKQVVVRLTNRGPREAGFRLVGIAEWVMGAARQERGTTQAASHRQRLAGAKLTVLTCTQRDRAGGFGGGTAFLALATPEAHGGEEDWTCDRRECFDARGRLVVPDLYGQRAGAGLDPCAVLATRVAVAPGATVERMFLLGWGERPDAARELAVRAATVGPDERAGEVRAQWESLLGATTVRTPDPLFDAMVNRWLLYQAVSSRLWAKAGFYQAGGATGFRDQLQDSLALAWAAPQALRSQIVTCASRQFPEGDVQHWWHAPGGAGVRTHFSDDLLWLPFACAHYLTTTGDAGVLDEVVPFLEAGPIPDGAEDAYTTPGVSAETASVYEHAARTLDRSLRSGVHGLPLMGTGDWNDGMNRVGHEGRGESVWLGWFLCRVIGDFAPVARARGEAARADRWQAAAADWREALLTAGWDGEWFKRAFFDDGEPLGSHVNAEARIDLIAQAWAVLSGVAPLDRQRQAMDAVERHLVDHDAGLLRLLTPPLADAVPSAGYIQAYPPGVRENGGQYSHAGVWALMARAGLERAEAGTDRVPDGDTVYRDFTFLSPAHRARDARHGEAYAIEPYVMAGDVYSCPPDVGRGGWSWYTGAAAWLQRAAIESMFGLELRADGVRLRPCLPSGWPWSELSLRRGGSTWRFILARTGRAGALSATAPWQPPGDARVLRRGEQVHFAEAADGGCWVVPLLEVEADGTEERG